MDQEGESAEKPSEDQDQEGGEETKADTDMEIDQLFMINSRGVKRSEANTDVFITVKLIANLSVTLF